MSNDQVRWRMNYLMKKYKQCIDNNLKSGRGTMSFEFFDEMENIFGCKKAAMATYSLSSNLPLKISKSLSTETEIQSPPSKKTKKNKDSVACDTLPSTSTSISTNASASNLVSISNNTSANKSKNINYENKENECTRMKPLSKLKDKFENFFLEYIQKEEKRREEHDENILKSKQEDLKFKKHYMQMREKELEVKKTVAINKIKSKEKRHDEILEIEKLKCDLLKKLLNKEHFKDSDSD